MIKGECVPLWRAEVNVVFNAIAIVCWHVRV